MKTKHFSKEFIDSSVVGRKIFTSEKPFLRMNKVIWPARLRGGRPNFFLLLFNLVFCLRCEFYPVMNKAMD